MKKKQVDMNALLAKRAALCDERIQRAEVRRVRALDNGNQWEADGAARTIEDAQYSAAQLRAQMSQ